MSRFKLFEKKENNPRYIGTNELTAILAETEVPASVLKTQTDIGTVAGIEIADFRPHDHYGVSMMMIPILPVGSAMDEAEIRNAIHCMIQSEPTDHYVINNKYRKEIEATSKETIEVQLYLARWHVKIDEDKHEHDRQAIIAAGKDDPIVKSIDKKLYLGEKQVWLRINLASLDYSMRDSSNTTSLEVTSLGNYAIQRYVLRPTSVDMKHIEAPRIVLYRGN